MNESMCFDCGENVKPTKDKKIFLIGKMKRFQLTGIHINVNVVKYGQLQKLMK